MTECEFHKVEGGWECSVCGRLWPFPNPPDGMNCQIDPPPKPSVWPPRLAQRSGVLEGPGDFLHDMIRFWLRQQPTAECGCADKIAQMNAWGVVGCREHLNEIIGWLVAKAREDKWKLANVPGAETLIRLMVTRAIRKAERAASG